MRKTKLFKIGEHSHYPNIRVIINDDTCTLQYYEYIDRQGTISKDFKEACTYNLDHSNLLLNINSDLNDITTAYYANKITDFIKNNL